MSELSKVKPGSVTLKLGGKDRQIKFGFSAWAKIEEKYGGINNLAQMEDDLQNKPFQTIPFLIWVGLQDKEGLKEETVLDEYSMKDVKEVSSLLATALYSSLPQEEEEKKTEANN